MNRVTLQLQDEPRPGDPPSSVRLRHVLKRLLRSYGFRAVRVEETTPAGDSPAPATDDGNRRGLVNIEYTDPAP